MFTSVGNHVPETRCRTPLRVISKILLTLFGVSQIVVLPRQSLRVFWYLFLNKKGIGLCTVFVWLKTGTNGKLFPLCEEQEILKRQN
jgi:hypothetical protein